MDSTGIAWSSQEKAGLLVLYVILQEMEGLSGMGQEEFWLPSGPLSRSDLLNLKLL